MNALSSKSWFRPTLWAVRVGYFVAVVVFVFWQRVFWTPDLLFIVLLGMFALWGQGWQFIKKFAPLIILLLSYDSLRGFASHVNSHVHFTLMPNFDTSLFGHLPTAWLQQHMYHGHVVWYDFGFYILYMMHFVLPVALAVYLWKKRPKEYVPFMTALLILSYAGFLTYLLYPAAPPWMASQMHIIEPIHRISSDVWAAIGVHNFPTLYHQFAPNDVAAVPSLHAAYPMLVWLFLRKVWKSRWVWVLLAYPAAVWLGVVYLGEHYVFDVLLGIVYALGAYLLSEVVIKYIEKNNIKPILRVRAYLPNFRRS